MTAVTCPLCNERPRAIYRTQRHAYCRECNVKRKRARRAKAWEGLHSSAWIAAHLAQDRARAHPEYVAWQNAKQRTTNPRNSHWVAYGGRGIRMAPEWLGDFWAFLAHIGPRPPGMTLDRIDVDGHYEPGNVRWASQVEQSKNRRWQGWTSEQVRKTWATRRARYGPAGRPNEDTR